MTGAPTRRAVISAVAVAAVAGCAPEPAPAAAPTRFDVVFARFIEAYDRYNQSGTGLTDGEEDRLEEAYDAAYCALRDEPPLTDRDFVRKFVGLYCDGGAPIKEVRDDMAVDARRLAGLS